MFRISQRVNKTESGISGIQENNRWFSNEIDNVHRRINEVSDLDNRRIDGEIDRVNKIADDIHRRVDIDVEGIYKTMDSRFDKLENKLTNNGKQLLKD